MATRRRISPELMRAFETASVEPFDMDSPGRVLEVPVPAEQFQQPAPSPAPAASSPKTRLQTVQEYLERTRAPEGPPDFGPEVDVAAARAADAQQNQTAALQDASMAFLGRSRGAPADVHTAEQGAMAQGAARKKAIADYYAQQGRTRMDEAQLLSGAAVEPREASKPAKTTEQIDRELDLKEFANETGRIKAEKVKPPKAPDATPLRKEFDALPEVKEYKGVFGSFEKVSQAAKDPSPAGDLALIYAFNKILDYGSAVKEAEFQNAQNAGSMFSKAQAAAEQVASGKRLTPEQRADFVAQARNVASAGRTLYTKQVERYRGFAAKKGIDLGDVAEDVGEVGAAPAAAPEKSPAVPAGKVPMVSESSGNVIFVTPATAEAGLKAKTLRKP